MQALELLTFNDLSCPQVAAAMQIHQRTARRLLLRLAADGYIEQTLDSRRRYRATLRLAALGCQVIAHAQLPRIAAPYVEALHTEAGVDAHLFIPSYRGVACAVHCTEPLADGPPEPALRELLPAHASAAGKVLLAFRQRWRDSVLADSLPRYTDATMTSNSAIQRVVTEIRALGYAIDAGEYQPGVIGLAVPVVVDAEVPAALALSRRSGKGVATWSDQLIGHMTTSAESLARRLDGSARR
jgi:DNA-binding IclR family transcriptional regulator